MNTKPIIKSVTIAVISAALLIAIDQITKYFAALYLKEQGPIDLIPGVFQLQYLENKGAAFGLLEGQKVLFVIATFFFLIVLGYCFYKIPFEKRFLPLRILTITLTAGALGNMIDRIWHNYVIDFFYFELINFAIFNVADIYITVSTVIVFILLLFYYKDEDLNRIFPKKGKKE